MIPIIENFSLRSHNTFHLNVKSKYYAEINSVDEIRDAIRNGQLQKFSENGLLLLGGGSNILFTRDYDGLVIHISNKGIESHIDPDNTVWVTASAGENWDSFVNWCVEYGYGGLENLSLIPGSVGSCPIQNIGAYGVEMKDCFHSLEAIDLQSGETRYFSKDECRFGYRDSIFKHEFKGKFIIWSVTFRLKQNPEVNLEYGAIRQELASMGSENPGIAEVSKAVCNIRQSKLPDPEKLGNAGSFFKNPVVDLKFAEKLKESFPNLVSYPAKDDSVKLAAGWLIEQCGWKGYRDGYVGVHESQALVLVNYGNATGADLLTLAHKVQNSVYLKFGVKLEMEVNII